MWEITIKSKIFFPRNIFFSEKNKLLKILLDKEINLNQFVIDIDPQNPKITLTEKDFQFYSDKKNKIDDNFLNLNKIEKKNSNTDFFNGKFLCNNDELIVSKSYNFFFNRVNLDYERIKVRIYNKSNSLWDINNFKNQNPISIRSYLKNSKNNSTIAGVDLSHKNEN